MSPKRYDKLIILIGTSHRACVYFRVIGKKKDGRKWAHRSSSRSSSGGMKHCDLNAEWEELQQGCIPHNLSFSVIHKHNRGWAQLVATDGLQEWNDDPYISNYFERYFVISGCLWVDEENTSVLGIRHGSHQACPTNAWSCECKWFWPLYTLLFKMRDLFLSYDAQNYAMYMIMFAHFLQIWNRYILEQQNC